MGKNNDAAILTKNYVSMGEGIAVNNRRSDINIEYVHGLLPQYPEYLHNAMNRNMCIIIKYISGYGN